MTGTGHGQCRGQTGDAGAHDDDFNVAHCVAFLCFLVRSRQREPERGHG